MPPPAPTSAMSIVGMRISSPLPRRSRLPAESDGADLVLLAERDAAVLDQRRLRGRAAHVERDHVLVAELLARAQRRDDARGRAGLQRVDRPRGRVLGGHHAAGGLETVSGAATPARVEPARARSPT